MSKDPYKCGNPECGRVSEYNSLNAAKDFRERIAHGDPYTDVECIVCGFLCYPVEEPALLTADDYEEALTDHRRLVKELDVLLNGEDGAARQASLCDIVAQVRLEKAAFCDAKKAMAALGISLPLRAAFSETEMSEILEIARVALCNADLFDHVADKLDLSDDYMIALRDKVNKLTSEEGCEEQNT
jgi:hypothetical protein